MIVIALFVFVFIAFALGFLYFWGINPGEVTVFLTSDLSITLPTTIVLICVLLIGLLVGNSVHIFSAFLWSLRSWKGKRSQKKAEETGSVYRMGVGRLLSGDLKKARTLLTKALDRDPQRVDTHLALATVSLQEGALDEGIELLQKARKLDPKGLEVLFKLGGTFEEAGRLQDAMAVYKEVLQGEPNNRKAMRAQRDLLIKLGDISQALELQKKIIKLTANGTKTDGEKMIQLQLRYQLAEQTLAEGDADKALAVCRDLVKQNDRFTPARVTLGDASLLAGRKDEAVRIYQDGYKALRKSVFLARLEDYFIKEENPAALLAFYRSQMEADPADLLLKLYLARLCLRLEMVDEAMQHLTDLENSNLDITKLHLLLAEAQRRRNKMDEAVREYQKALGIDAHLQLGFVCENCRGSFADWQARCPDCGEWDTLVLPERQQISDAKLVETPKAIPHGA